MLGFRAIGAASRRILVLNDWLCDTTTWDPTQPYLDEDSFAWTFVDLRGYGRSRRQSGTFVVEESAADVIALADHHGWTRFTIVGHSMSTLVATHLAQTHPTRIERVVLVTPPPPTGFGYDDATHARLKEVALGDDARRTKALEVMVGDRLGAEWLRFKVKRWGETADREAVAAFIAMFGVRGLPDTQTKVTCPVLAITGEHDAPPMRREGVARWLEGLCPRSTLVSIAESGHYPMQETPPLFAAAVQRFLREA